METVCQIEFSLMTRPEARNAEAVLREYLLRVSDQMALARKSSSWLTLLPMPHPFRNRQFESKMQAGDVVTRGEHSWMFNLTDNIRNLLNQATLFNLDAGNFFYGFSDPKFYQHGREIAEMVSSERLITLHISDSDKAALADKGVYVDSPQI